MIKREVRMMLSGMIGKNKDEIPISVIEQADIVSFDMYDTLILRNCKRPEDLFTVVERRYNREFGKNYSFSEMRIQAEKKARGMSHDEVDLKDIYTFITSIPKDELKVLYDYELEAEKDFATPNSDMVELFNACKGMGKKTVIISDMYLPSDFLKTILVRCGIEGEAFLAVSCEYKKTKRDGCLFDMVFREEDLSQKKIVHIGDHLISDYLSPGKKGITAFLYRKRANNNWILSKHGQLNEGNQIEAGIIEKISQNSAQNDELNYLVGNRVLAPMLFGYCSWLYNYVKQQNILNIVFLAREGYIIQKAFDELFGDDSLINSFYINVSRLSVCRASVHVTSNFDSLVRLFSSLMLGVENVDDFIELLVGKEKMQHDHEYKDTKMDSLNSQQKEEVYKYIISNYGNFFDEQWRYLKEYLDQRGFNKDIVAISDIGWSGTMQMCLENIYPDITIVGNYLGVSSVNTKSCYLNLTRRGYYCDFDDWNERGQAIRFTQSAIETLFMSSEGTTLQYEKENGIVYAKKSESSWDSKSIRAFAGMEQGAVDYIKKCKDTRLYEWIGVGGTVECFDAYHRFAVYPNRSTLAFYKQFNFVDGINTVEFLPQKSFFHYLINIKDLKNELETNNSKIIWLYALTKVRIPYYTLLLFLTKKVGLESNYSKKYLKNRRDRG